MTVAPTPKIGTPPGMFVSVTSLEPAPWDSPEEAQAKEEALAPELKSREIAVRKLARQDRRERLADDILENTRLTQGPPTALGAWMDRNEWALLSILPILCASLIFWSLLPVLGAAIVVVAMFADGR
jgi:Flp pilus assembly protein TadB